MCTILPGARLPNAHDDEEYLRSAGVDVSDRGLVAFVYAQSLTGARELELRGMIRRLGNHAYLTREQASRDIVAVGPPALPLLRDALKTSDLEIVRRAELCLEDVERQASRKRKLLIAAVRVLAARKPPGAVEALLVYLPSCEDEQMEEEIYTTLAAVAIRNGKLDPCIGSYLTDSHPARRAAAGFVGGRANDFDVRQMVRNLLNDADANVRLRAAGGLLIGRDKAGVPTLISLLGETSPALSGKAEELLFRIAGESTPKVCLADGSAAARRNYCEAWSAWWRKSADAIDWQPAALEEPHLRFPLVVEMDSNKVWESGLDGRARWELRGLQGPMDAQLLPNGRILVAEYQGRIVTERDREGKIHWSKRVDESPIACRRLANGNTFIATHTMFMELAPDGQSVYLRYPGDGLFLFGVQRLSNGRIVYIANPGIIQEVEAATGKPLKTIHLGNVSGGWSGIEAVPGGCYLAAFLSSGKVLELDPAGKAIWEFTMPGACHATRLANGHTLVASTTRMKLVEVDRAGKIVRETRTEGRPWNVHSK
jgi:HEAT repeat protein